MSDTDDLIRQLILPKLQKVRRGQGGWTACCPAHEDSTPSMSVGPGQNGKIVIHCHAGCETDTILEAVGLSWSDLSGQTPDSRPAGVTWTPYGDAVTVYDYVDADGRLLFQVCRTASKQFPQRVPDQSKRSGWKWTTSGVKPVPYRLPRLIEAVANGELILICEGEKDVQAAEAAGFTATCNPGGAGKWRAEFSRYFKDACVWVVADRDEPGRKHARTVCTSLAEVASFVHLLEPKEGKDLSDHLAAGLSIDDLSEAWKSGDEGVVELAPDLLTFIAGDDPPRDWIIEDILERGDRLVWTGREGFGKSMVLRQLAVAAAAGLHPFRPGKQTYDTRRVLYIDCENPKRVSRPHFKRLVACTVDIGQPVKQGTFFVIHRPEGVDLNDADDAAWLTERVHVHRPDLLVIGPMYKLHSFDINEEQSARTLTRIIDELRSRYECTVAIEAHAGHSRGDEDPGIRSVRPAGSSLLLRWPEFGYGIRPISRNKDANEDKLRQPKEVEVVSWRGPRAERIWPAQLRWADKPEWPWVPLTW